MNRFHLLLGVVAAAVATIVAVTIVADPTPAPADPFAGLHLSAGEDELANDEILNAPIVSYESESMEYTVKYPGTWELDDTKESFNGHILTDPREHVIITITETENDALLTPEGTKQVAQSIKESLKYDPAFTLESFQQFIWRGHPTMFTEGQRSIGGDTYHTREYNIVRDDHNSMLNVSITTKKELEDLYEEPIQQILHSLHVCHDISIEP